MLFFCDLNVKSILVSVYSFYLSITFADVWGTKFLGHAEAKSPKIGGTFSSPHSFLDNIVLAVNLLSIEFPMKHFT